MKRSRKRARKRSRPQGDAPQIMGPAEADAMREAGRFAAELLDIVAAEVGPGVTTGAIDRIVDEATRARGARSAPYGYGGRHGGTPPFPGHCCTSVNDVVCHGIPDDACVLREGDIVNVDVTPIIDGFHGDSSRTFLIGEVTPKARHLVADTWRAMWLGIGAIRPGGKTGDIGHAIQRFVEAEGYSVVREFTGHGVGRIFHSAPTILHYGTAGAGDPIEPGMTFTVEPMINLGAWRTEVLDDGWTAVTRDGSLSAQCEHTILVTEDGAEVLTLGKEEQPPS